MKSGLNRRTAIIVAAVVVVAAAGVAAAASHDTPSPSGMSRSRVMHQGPTTTPEGPSQSWGSMMRAFGVAGEPEYLAEMVAHHREAVEAAGELRRSGRANMRSFGEVIVKTQSAQIQQMEAWLRAWYAQQPTADYRPMMRDLSDLSGDNLDRAFLRDMIGHHMTAVMMSQHLLRIGTEHEEVSRLARSIRDDQHAEIIQMRRWLSQWFDDDWHGLS